MHTVTATVVQTDYLHATATLSTRAVSTPDNPHDHFDHDEPITLVEGITLDTRDPNPVDLAHALLPAANLLFRSAHGVTPNLVVHGFAFPFHSPDSLITVIEFDYDEAI